MAEPEDRALVEAARELAAAKDTRTFDDLFKALGAEIAGAMTGAAECTSATGHSWGCPLDGVARCLVCGVSGREVAD